ncbi:MAG: DUF5665 domain-containing protein [Clostridium sp.]
MSQKQKETNSNIDTEEKMKIIQKISDHFERARIADYVELMQTPRRMVIMNFIAGVARGFGFAVGFAMLGAILVYTLQKILILNLPIVSDIIAEMVNLVQLKLR